MNYLTNYIIKREQIPSNILVRIRETKALETDPVWNYVCICEIASGDTNMILVVLTTLN